MIRKFMCAGLLVALPVAMAAQKSKVLSVFQLIEAENYGDAKEAMEQAIWNEKTSGWPRTYYAKGLLCQKAFEAGFEKNDRDKTGLYPDQLFVAYDAYEKALELDKRNRLRSAVATQYYGLANDFQKLGERQYRKKEYAKALEAFEHALLVSKSPLLTAETDTGLVYNTALAAYESGNREKAISYLTGLNGDSFSPNTALLLFRAHLESGDSLMAEEVLADGVDRYDCDQAIVLELVDFLVNRSRTEDAIRLLDTAMVRKPGNPVFPWSCGLVYQQKGAYGQAIELLMKASRLAPEEPMICYHLGICNYNIGVAINEAARHIRDNARYRVERERARARFMEAVKWLEKAHEMDPGYRPAIAKLQQLYYHLQMTDKQKAMELLLD
jgi:tetratricopeptide (TPR) repeat protein